MKQKLFMVLAAMMLLVSPNVSAQNAQQNEVKDTTAVATAKVKAEKQATPKKAESQTPLKGDVNEDGKVDVADIAAIIAIMKANGGEDEGPVYYWYVGTEEPTTSTNPANNLDNEHTAHSTGWTKLSAKPENGIKIFKETPDWSDVQWYLAAPAEWNYVTSYNGWQVGGWTKTTVTIKGVLYNVWTCMALADSVNVTLANVGAAQ